MDLYSNNRMLDWESRRRIDELRSMSRRVKVEESIGESHDAAPNGFMNIGCVWNGLFHRTNHNYERA